MHKIEIGQENVKEEKNAFLHLTSKKEEYFDFSLGSQEKKQILLFASSHSFQHITCHLGKMSSLILVHVGFNSNDSIDVFLEGEDASFQYYYISLSRFPVFHEVSVHHLKDRTTSTLQNHGVNLQDKSMKFYIDGFVNKDTKNCVLEQNSRIVDMEDGVSTILPNLAVDSYQVVANHSAHIGKFTQEELFYLTSRGISFDESYQLLLQGFLLANLPCSKEEIELIRHYYKF